MAKNSNLHAAKAAKNDEFYTQLSDIEKEMNHYRDEFRDKIVYCNCDDARQSNFFKYFSMNFEFLGLKQLITTSFNPNGKGTILVYNGDKNQNGVVDDEEIEVTELEGDGDFRSEECKHILESADIVVTNPPFSLFREFVAQLMEYGKKFIILGNMNAITYKEVFPLIKDNKMWCGVGFNKVMEFTMPDNYEKYDHIENGKKIGKVPAICWYTNMNHPKRNHPLDLYKKYNEEEFPKYDNYDAIEVSKTVDIPMDYDGVMGVPISFLDKYCPTQFRIVKFRKGNDDKDLSVNGKCPYFRILIQKFF